MGGGSGGPITGELIRGVPGKGEGPLVPALPTPSIAVEGEEVLGSLLIKDATAGPISKKRAMSKCPTLPRVGKVILK